jgi:adenylate kinase family enzyme
MKLIIIYGAPAVGKLTTANELSKKTGYPILHNHMTLDLAINYFPFNSKPFSRLTRKIRLSIVKELLSQKTPGLIWTTGFPNTPDLKRFYSNLDNFMKKNGGTTYYIKLICAHEEQKKRVLGKERKRYNKLNTVSSLKKSMQALDFNTQTPKEKTIVIDNTHLSLTKTVAVIMKFISSKRRK